MTNAIFVDTFFWIAEIDAHDQWHARCIRARHRVRGRPLITSEDVLSELMNYMSGLGPMMRSIAVGTVRRLLESPVVEVIPHTHDGFVEALRLYEARRDKRYSMTDCSSMAYMKRLGIVEILTNDHHFTQEGFVALLV